MGIGKFFGRRFSRDAVPAFEARYTPDATFAQATRSPRRKRAIHDARFSTNELLPVFRSPNGSCEICSQPSGQYEMCFSCRSCVDDLDGIRTHVLPIALAVKHGPIAKALWEYKNSAKLAERQEATRKLSDLTQRYLARHERCLARSVGADTFDIITWVPSSQGRAGRHPLADMLYSLPWSQGRIFEGLSTNPSSHGESHQADKDKFISDPVFRGKHVLIVDDTWTRGANALSAANSVRSKGAKSVAIAVIGRHFDRDYKDSYLYSDHAESLGFDFNTCNYCNSELQSAFSGLVGAVINMPGGRQRSSESERQTLPPELSEYQQEVADMKDFARIYGNESFELLLLLRDMEFARYRKALASLRAGRGQAVADALAEWGEARVAGEPLS